MGGGPNDPPGKFVTGNSLVVPRLSERNFQVTILYCSVLPEPDLC